MEFTAKNATVENDGYCTVLAFADGPHLPERYVIMQLVNKPSAEDIKLGQAGVHFELGAELSGYDLLEKIDLTANGLMLAIKASAASEVGVDPLILVKLEPEQINDQIRDTLRSFRQRLPSD